MDTILGIIKTWLGFGNFFHAQLSTKFNMLMNVKMHSIFISMSNTISENLKAGKVYFTAF